MPNRPTKERMSKADWETIGRSKRRAKTIEALRSRLKDTVLSDAQEWLKNWELAANGYCDAMKDGGNPAVPGNLFTFTVLRGKAWGPIREFKNYAGADRHKLLVQLLAFGWSFTSIGRHWWPNNHIDRARKKAADFAEETLEMLHEFFTERRKEYAKRATDAAKAYQKHPSIPALCRKFNLGEAGMKRLIEQGQKRLSKPRHGLTGTSD